MSQFRDNPVALGFLRFTLQPIEHIPFMLGFVAAINIFMSAHQRIPGARRDFSRLGWLTGAHFGVRLTGVNKEVGLRCARISSVIFSPEPFSSLRIAQKKEFTKAFDAP